MSEDKDTPETTLETVRDLLKAIPNGWRFARIALSYQEHECLMIRGVRFCENGDGQKVVVLASKPMKIFKDN